MNIKKSFFKMKQYYCDKKNNWFGYPILLYADGTNLD